MRQISTQRHQLAEGPFWSQSQSALYWVDIPAGQVWRWHQPSDTHQHWQLPSKVSAVFTTQSERLLVTLADRVAYFDPATQTLETLCRLDVDCPGNRANDAKCDPNGVLWVGTMDDAETQVSGRLWLVDGRGQKTCLLDKVGIANTLAWDTTRDRVYFGDSMAGKIHAYSWSDFRDCRQDTAFIQTPEGMGPDGSAIDLEGCLWNAQWDGARVVRYSPKGEILQIIALPFAKPTSCVLGGVDGKTLFITSASVAMSEDSLTQYPLAGHVIAIDVDVAGEPSQPFQGA